MPHLIFVPGPGFSSWEEHRVLGPELQREGWTATFWNDPARSAAGADVMDHDGYLGSIEAHVLREAGSNELTIAAHSAAVHDVAIVLRRAQPRVRRIVLVAPSIDLHDSLMRVAKLAAEDFAIDDPARSAQIRQLTEQSREFFDQPMQEALGLAAEDQKLLGHYWKCGTASANFTSTMQRREARFMPEVFFSRMAAFASASSYLRDAPLRYDSFMLFGGADPVIDSEVNRRAGCALFRSTKATVVAGGGHWVHLERPLEFVRALVK